jgi:hypothetical protein
VEQDKEKELLFTDAFIERTGGYETYNEDIRQLFAMLDIKNS